jgi:hypothetical protein
MRIGSKSFPGLWVLAVGVALALAGCVPTTAIPTDAATPSATPSPTPTAAALPVPTLPVTCADVLSDQAASDILGVPVQLKVNETTIRNIFSIATRQAGLLSCVWGGQYKTDNMWDDHIELDVLPNAAAEYDAGVWKVDDGATPYTVGDISEYLCPYADGTQSWCTANLLVNGYWAQMNSMSGAPGITIETAEHGMAMLLDSLAATIGGAGKPAPAWAPPSGAITGAFCGDVAGSTATMQAAFALPGLYSDPYNPPPPYGASDVASQRSGEKDCTWSSSDQGRVFVRVVPGGAWAFPAMAASPPKTSYALPAMAPVTVSGTEAAFVACGDGCSALLSIGGSTVSVGVDNPDQAAFEVALPAVAAAILAAG